MKRKYNLPFKTRLVLFMISAFRKRSTEPPTPKELRMARRSVPRMFITNWVLGKPARCHSVTDRMIPVRDGEIPVRIYRPNTEKNLPLILNYHGGGWAVGNLQNNDYYCAALAKEIGALVVSVDYRLAPEHKFPKAVHDAYDALVWATDNAATLGVDTGRVCVTGDSAGGNLSAAICILSRDLGGPAIHYQALIYPATDSRLEYASFEKYADAPILTKHDILNYLEMYMSKPEDRLSPLLSPIFAESLAGLPPALIVTAGYDPLCDDGQQYADRLKAEGVTVEVLHYPEDVHGFFTLPNHTKSGKEATVAVAKRIAKALAIKQLSHKSNSNAMARASALPLLNRYMAGEYNAVIREIQSMGEAALDPTISSDVDAVLKEMFTRVAKNLRLIFQGLVEIGYQFDNSIAPPMEGPLGNTDLLWRDVEKKVSPFGFAPVALKYFYQIVGGVNFGWDCRKGNKPLWVFADPIQIERLDALVSYLNSDDWAEEIQQYVDDEEFGLAFLELSADALHKDNVSGGPAYAIAVSPTPNVDGAMLNLPEEMSFIEYLRVAIMACGFPGIKDPSTAVGFEAFCEKVRPQLLNF